MSGLLFENDPARTADLHDPDTSDLIRRVANLLRLGTVCEVRYGAAKVRVQIGKLKTAWLSWLTHRAGPDATWWAPEIGEQVLVLAPSGNLQQALVLGAVYRDRFPGPQPRETIHYTKYADGTVVAYDRASHRLTVDCVGEVEVTAAEKVTITASEISMVGHVTVRGNVDVQGNVNASGNVIDGGLNTNHHTHP